MRHNFWVSVTVDWIFQSPLASATSFILHYQPISLVRTCILEFSVNKTSLISNLPGGLAGVGHHLRYTSYRPVSRVVRSRNVYDLRPEVGEVIGEEVFSQFLIYFLYTFFYKKSVYKKLNPLRNFEFNTKIVKNFQNLETHKILLAF